MIQYLVEQWLIPPWIASGRSPHHLVCPRALISSIWPDIFSRVRVLHFLNADTHIYAPRKYKHESLYYICIRIPRSRWTYHHKHWSFRLAWASDTRDLFQHLITHICSLLEFANDTREEIITRLLEYTRNCSLFYIQDKAKYKCPSELCVKDVAYKIKFMEQSRIW